jgi:Asp-tRNA(Asn)/Glu-tRNA(Gln) amidotransferase C subunit
MAWSKEERVRELARLVGIAIVPEEETEVADRFESLMKELDALMSFDLADIEPVTIFPEEP